jgi:hypothetical protein
MCKLAEPVYRFMLRNVDMVYTGRTWAVSGAYQIKATFA